MSQLALGHVNPRYRSDLGFGIVFFIVRVAYFGYAIYQLYLVQSILWKIGCLPLGAHLYWFERWCRSYGRKRAIHIVKRRASEEPQDKEEETAKAA